MKILKRDEYIREVYDPMLEKKWQEEVNMINEGLLKTLFGMAKNLFKKDWATIKGDSNIIKIYKEMDDRLSGFSTMKLAKKGECNQIRQALVDFADDWYEFKMNQAKDSGEDPKVAKSMEFKDTTLRDNLEATQKKIKDIAKDDTQMLNWANALLNDMKSVINRAIISEIQDEKVKKDAENQIKEDEKKSDELNKEQKQIQDEWMKDIENERSKIISNAKVTPIKDDLMGDAAIKELVGDFNKIKEVKDKAQQQKKNQVEAVKKAIQGNELLGLKSIFTEKEFEDKKAFKKAYDLMNSFYENLNKNENMKRFENTPGASVQAMCIAVNMFIKSCIYGTELDKNSLSLMAKCAIVSNDLTGYKLPLINPKETDPKKQVNFFTNALDAIKNGKFQDVEGKALKLVDDVQKQALKLFGKIQQQAEKMLKATTDKYNAINKQLQSKEAKIK